MFYHGCLEEDLLTILSQGLSTELGISARTYKDKPSIYLSKNPKEAGKYGNVILEVDIPESLVVKGYGSDWISYDDIPPEAIRVHGPSEERKTLGYQIKKRR